MQTTYPGNERWDFPSTNNGRGIGPWKPTAPPKPSKEWIEYSKELLKRISDNNHLDLLEKFDKNKEQAKYTRITPDEWEKLEKLKETFEKGALVKCLQTAKKAANYTGTFLLSGVMLTGVLAFIAGLLPAAGAAFAAAPAIFSWISLDAGILGVSAKISAVAIDWFKQYYIKRTLAKGEYKELASKMKFQLEFEKKLPRMLEYIEKTAGALKRQEFAGIEEVEKMKKRFQLLEAKANDWKNVYFSPFETNLERNFLDLLAK